MNNINYIKLTTANLSRRNNIISFESQVIRLLFKEPTKENKNIQFNNILHLLRYLVLF